MTEKPLWRRRYPRISSQHAVLVKRLGEEELEGFGRTKTMAVGGCSFVSDESYGEGSALELLIAVEHRVVSSRGRVVYENPLEDGRFEVGVEFLQLDDSDLEVIQKIFENPVVPAD